MHLSVKKVVIAGLFIVGSIPAFAQSADNNVNPYVRLGQKALIDGDFKVAVTNLEKALPSDPQNLDILYMLGYSQYQSNDYTGAAKSFSTVIKGRPTDVSAYYYRAKAQNTLAVDPDSKLNDGQRSDLLQASISDYTKAIEMNDSDAKLYQNRAMAYRDLGNLIGTTSSKNYNKTSAIESYDNCIKDLETVLKRNPNRKDLDLELKKVKVYRSSL
ncbi:tetratricopeptide repeat protein [Albibacterium sp.]|uniref:tetratricopeptide repeat protein n=1 Tax=Albibacterium sp. TaxID=2952885 RepID=UPI002D7FA7F2|nr:tetratricopeptide repeat protein [Albibacterium sp.]